MSVKYTDEERRQAWVDLYDRFGELPVPDAAEHIWKLQVEINRLRAATPQPPRESLDKQVERQEMIGLRKRIHQLEGHNQHFERCESGWCNPSADCNPARGMFGLHTALPASPKEAAGSEVIGALRHLLTFCDQGSDGETEYERAVIRARAAISQVPEAVGVSEEQYVPPKKTADAEMAKRAVLAAHPTAYAKHVCIANWWIMSLATGDRCLGNGHRQWSAWEDAAQNLSAPPSGEQGQEGNQGETPTCSTCGYPPAECVCSYP